MNNKLIIIIVLVVAAIAVAGMIYVSMQEETIERPENKTEEKVAPGTTVAEAKGQIKFTVKPPDSETPG